MTPVEVLGMIYTLVNPQYCRGHHSKMVQQSHLRPSKRIAQVDRMADMDVVVLLQMLVGGVGTLPDV
jgi:hypothetical protein